MLWGGWGERKRERAGPPARFLFLSIIDILMGYPAGASAEERANTPQSSSLNENSSCKTDKENLLVFVNDQWKLSRKKGKRVLKSNYS